MNELGTALRELAREAEPDVADAPALWRRGRRRVRRRRVVAGAILAGLVVLAGLGGLMAPKPTYVMPAGPVHAPGLPKNVYTPSRWLAGTDDEGPLGRLAVLGRSTGRRGDTAFGISATTGEYRFLDLPGRVRDTAVALSPSGRYVAYWTTGPTRHQDFPPANGVNSVGGPVVDPVTGIAVYDSVDGSVVRHLVPSDYGLSVDGWEPELLWPDDDTVLFSFGYLIGTNAGNRYGAYRWQPATDELRQVADKDRWGRFFVLPDGSLAGEAGNFDGEGPSSFEPLTADLKTAGDPVRLPYGNYVDYSRIGDRVAVTGYQGNGGIQRVRTGVVGPGSRVLDLAPVDGIVLTELLGWRSDHTILVAAAPGERRPQSEIAADDPMGEDAGWGIAYQGNSDQVRWGLYEVDLISRKVHRLGTAGDLGQQIMVAQDLLGAPMVIGREPPHPLDPRVRDALVGGGLVLATGMIIMSIRSRRRGRRE